MAMSNPVLSNRPSAVRVAAVPLEAGIVSKMSKPDASVSWKEHPELSFEMPESSAAQRVPFASSEKVQQATYSTNDSASKVDHDRLHLEVVAQGPRSATETSASGFAAQNHGHSRVGGTASPTTHQHDPGQADMCEPAVLEPLRTSPPERASVDNTRNDELISHSNPTPSVSSTPHVEEGNVGTGHPQALPRISSASANSAPECCPTPSWVAAVLNHAVPLSRQGSTSSARSGHLDSPSDVDDAMVALDMIQRGRVAPAVVYGEGGISQIIDFLTGEPMSMVKDGADLSLEIAAASALYVLASDAACLTAMLQCGALELLCRLVLETSSSKSNNNNSNNSNSNNNSTNNARGDDRARNTLELERKQGSTTRANREFRRQETQNCGSQSRFDPAIMESMLPRSLWAAVVGTIAKLVICSSDACSMAVASKAVSILASAALPSEHVAIRSRAAAGLAIVAIWSGPRFAVDILRTPNVIEAMSGVLTDSDIRISSHLRRATFDGFATMARRPQARQLLKARGFESILSKAARCASSSGDYDFAAHSTFTAGQLTGHSVDEFGFLITADRESRDNFTPMDKTPSSNSLCDADVPNAPTRPHSSVYFLRSEMMNEKDFVLVDLIERVESNSENQAQVNAVASATGVVEASHARNFSQSRGDRACPAGLRQNLSLRSAQRFREGRDNESYCSALVTFSSVAKQVADVGSARSSLQESVAREQEEAESESQWQRVLQSEPHQLDRENGKQGRVKGYPTLAKVPVPSHLRPQVWPVLLEIDSLKAKKPDLFSALHEKAKAESLPDDVEHTISADVTRTMPLHGLFWSGGAQIGVDSLRIMLRCYALYVPDVGYCQGMSSIAALFLLNALNEEDAFLMLVRFMSRYGYNKLFLPGFPQYHEWLAEIRPVIPHLLPRLSARLEAEGIAIELFADKWLITALTHSFPHRLLLRIWDVMLLSGSPRIILKSCIAVLLLSESHILNLDFEGILSYLQRGFADPETGILSNRHEEEFLNVARAVKLEVPANTTGDQPATGGLPGAETTAQQQASSPSRRRKALSACFGSCFKSKTE